MESDSHDAAKSSVLIRVHLWFKIPNSEPQMDADELRSDTPTEKSFVREQSIIGGPTAVKSTYSVVGQRNISRHPILRHPAGVVKRSASH